MPARRDDKRANWAAALCGSPPGALFSAPQLGFRSGAFPFREEAMGKLGAKFSNMFAVGHDRLLSLDDRTVRACRCRSGQGSPEATDLSASGGAEMRSILGAPLVLDPAGADTAGWAVR
jgi:hypothetical protein